MLHVLRRTAVLFKEADTAMPTRSFMWDEVSLSLLLPLLGACLCVDSSYGHDCIAVSRPAGEPRPQCSCPFSAEAAAGETRVTTPAQPVVQRFMWCRWSVP